MILISHRGNIEGKFVAYENSPQYIDLAISKGFEVEVDIHIIDGKLFLGHDTQQYSITKYWLTQRSDKLWIHCKNIEAIEWISLKNVFNYFWHQEDTLTLTSKGYIWAYPGNQPIKNSIAVMPELFNDEISQCLGICSDYIQHYKK
jgi:hypothetical protein